MWAVLYDDGMSLTTANEQIARSLAEAERLRGHRVTVRRLDDIEPAQAAEPASAPEPASEASPPELSREPEPARAPAPAPARRRRLLLYALAAVSIIVAAALFDHWSVLPRVGADTSARPAQVGGPPHLPQLLPPLDQPPVMHFTVARGGGH